MPDEIKNLEEVPSWIKEKLCVELSLFCKGIFKLNSLFWELEDFLAANT